MSPHLVVTPTIYLLPCLREEAECPGEAYLVVAPLEAETPRHS